MAFSEEGLLHFVEETLSPVILSLILLSAVAGLLSVVGGAGASTTGVSSTTGADSTTGSASGTGTGSTGASLAGVSFGGFL